MRLWIDDEAKALLRAEFRDADGERIKRMDVLSFKKVDEMFTLQDIEVKRYPERTSTVLRVDHVEPMRLETQEEETEN